MKIFNDIEYIPFKEWNSTLMYLNNDERARYFEVSIPVLDTSTIPERVTEVINEFNDTKKVYYSYNIKPAELEPYRYDGFTFASVFTEDDKRVPGFKVTVKIADTLKLDNDSPSYLAVRVAEKIANRELNRFHSFIPKITPLTKDKKAALIQNQKLKDKFGVEIEIGDYVAHPSGTYGGGSSVEILKVDSFGVGTANGWKADRLVVIKTNNANKKLGWG